MSVEAMAWAFSQNTETPEAKLLLIWMSNNGQGPDRVDLQAAASFCRTTPAGAKKALDECVRLGLVAQLSAEFTSLCFVPKPASGPKPYRKKVLSASKRRRVFERDSHKCCVCSATDDLTLDHIEPEALGGSHDDDNLRTLCRSCNSRKGTKVLGGAS